MRYHGSEALDRLATMQVDAIAQLLRARELRVTPQRRAILQAFLGRTDEHLSADEVLARASSVVPEIGRGTVYATLAELTELNLLASVGSPEPVRYEINLKPHDHFHCRVCLRLFDVELGGDELRERSLPGYEIEGLAIRAEGLCSQCRDYVRGLSAGVAQVNRQATVDEPAMSELTCATVVGPLGALALAASAEGVARVAFEHHADFAALAARARSRRGPVAGRRRLHGVATTLEEYFGGSRRAAHDGIDWRFAAPASVEALLSVNEIPYGEPCSYDRLAGDLSAYDCGYAMGRNPVPLLIPCHRVCRGSRRPEAYVGGPDRLRLLQQLEAG
jgi:Fe2+ or Zn2+ uptake regulation protein/O6-methylguanine-DNA--protein-cysteine methyltransferase